MKSVFSKTYTDRAQEITTMIAGFDTQGELFIAGQRNMIKLFHLSDVTLNVKSFRIPNLVNQIAYKYFRRSKARRSFDFANVLLAKGIGTPQPVAYFECGSALLSKSYYISEQLVADLTFRELTNDLNYPDHENILRQFTQFTFELHEKGIEFLDHTPGNTLIRKIDEGKYEFFLVDLNRMRFHNSIDFNTRIANMSKLTNIDQIISVMSDEYAKLYGKPAAEVHNCLIQHTENFQKRLVNKKWLKKKLLFWRKK